MRNVAKGVYQLDSGRYRWRVTVAGVPYAGTCDSLAEARRARLDAELVATSPRRQVDAGTVLDVVGEWIPESGQAKSTARRRDSALNQIPVEFLNARAADVDVPAVRALWRTMKRNGVGPTSIRKARNALSRSFAMAVEDGLLPSNPFRQARLDKYTQPPIHSPAPVEVRHVLERLALADVRHPGLSILGRIMATNGPRPGEVCALRWETFKPKLGTIHVGPSITGDGEVTDGKNGPEGWRTVELDPAVVRMLKAHQRIVGSPWIFQTNGEPWRPDDVARWFRKAAPDVTWRLYDLRHFAATEALNAGVPIHKVAYMLGDDPATVLAFYTRAKDDGGAGAAVGRLLG